MRYVFFWLGLIFLAVTACSTAEEEPAQSAALEVYETSEAGIADFVCGYDAVLDCVVRLDDTVAVVGVKLKRPLGDTELVALKTQIKQGVMAHFPELSHVAITCAAEMFEMLNLIDV